MSISQTAVPPLSVPAADAANDEPTKCDVLYCWACANVLSVTARKCTKCDSWQKGLRSILPFTDASLSVFLALVSVLTIVVPPAVRWLARESLTRIAIVTMETNRDLQVAVSNVGRRPTVLRSYTVEFEGADFLPARALVPRNTQNALLMPEKDATVQLHGAAKILLPESRKGDLERWIESGTVTLTACVKESGSGVAKANALAGAGTCESRGLVSRTDSIAAIHLKDWIEGVVQWESTDSQ